MIRRRRRKLQYCYEPNRGKWRFRQFAKAIILLFGIKVARR